MKVLLLAVAAARTDLRDGVDSTFFAGSVRSGGVHQHRSPQDTASRGNETSSEMGILVSIGIAHKRYDHGDDHTYLAGKKLPSAACLEQAWDNREIA